MTNEQRQAAYDAIMGLEEADRCKGFLILEKFNFKPPRDPLDFGFLAYMLSEGRGKGAAAARYFAAMPEVDYSLPEN